MSPADSLLAAPPDLWTPTERRPKTESKEQRHRRVFAAIPADLAQLARSLGPSATGWLAALAEEQLVMEDQVRRIAAGDPLHVTPAEAHRWTKGECVRNRHQGATFALELWTPKGLPSTTPLPTAWMAVRLTCVECAADARHLWLVRRADDRLVVANATQGHATLLVAGRFRWPMAPDDVVTVDGLLHAIAEPFAARILWARVADVPAPAQELPALPPLPATA